MINVENYFDKWNDPSSHLPIDIDINVSITIDNLEKIKLLLQNQFRIDT